MSREGELVHISDHSVKIFFGVVQAIVLFVLFGSIGWAWDVEKRVALVESRLDGVDRHLALVDKSIGRSDIDHTEIELIKVNLHYIKQTLDDIKVAVKEIDQ